MNLTKLKTKNFKALGTKEFEFTSGLNFVLGENGKGKTTLFRAISVALYGSGSLPGVADNIASWGETIWSLELQYTLKGSQYTVTRSKSSASLHRNEELIASGHTPVTKEVEVLLGMSLKDFDLLVHSKQSETGYILTYGATALQRKVEELAGVDFIEAVSKKSKEARKVATLISENTQIPESRADEIEALKAELNVELPKVEEPNEPTVTVNEVSAKLLAWNKYQSDLEKLSDLNEKISEMSEDLANLPEVESADISELTEKLNALKGEKAAAEEIERTSSATKLQLARLGEELKELPPENHNYEADWNSVNADLTSSIESLELESDDLAAELSTCKLNVEHLQTHIDTGECGSCGTILTEGVEEAKEKLVAETANLENLKASRNENAKNKRRLQELLNKAETTYNQEVKNVEARKKLVAEEAKLRADWEAIEIPHFDEARLEEVQLKLVRAKELQSAALEVEDKRVNLSRRIRSLEASKPKLPEEVAEATKEELEAAELAWSEFYNNLKEFNAFIARLTHLNSVKAQLGRLLGEEERRAEALQQVESSKIQEDKLKRLEQYLGKRREQYLKEIWDAVMSLASDTLNTYTEGWITELAVMDGKFVFMENGVWTPIVEASGAQESFVGAALRQSLKKCLQSKSTFMMFDEPTGAMTETRARQLVDSLANSAKQVFVITHRQTDSNLADNIINVQ